MNSLRIENGYHLTISGLTDIFGANLTISQHIQYNEAEDKFEMAY